MIKTTISLVATIIIFVAGGISLADINENESEYNVLLVHSNNPDGSTSFFDSSENRHEIFVHGDVQHAADPSKVGRSSIYFDGDKDYLSISDSADWDFGSGDFTTDFWVNFNNTATTQIFWEQGPAGADYIQVFFSSDTLHFYAQASPSILVHYSTPWAPATGVWYHIAAVRNGTRILLFIDGQSQPLTVTQVIGTSSLPNVSEPLTIGARSASGEYSVNGYIDEFRISKGIAHWTSDFTPPLNAYGSSPKYITAAIDHTKIEEDLKDFPVLVHLSEESGLNGSDVSDFFRELSLNRFTPNDSFDGNNGDNPDSDRWVIYHGAPELQNGRLHLDTSSGKEQIRSRYQLSGDFDVQVDWDIDNIVEQEWWISQLILYFPQNNNHWCYAGRGFSSVGSFFRSRYNNGGSNTTVQSTDAGDIKDYSLRLVRTGDSITFYYKTHTDWISLGTQQMYATDCEVAVYLTNGDTNPSVSGFADNFVVNQGAFVWADGHPYLKKFAVHTADGKQCYTEIEEWDPANQEAWLWVKVPSISSIEDTHLKIFYDRQLPDNLGYVGEASDNRQFQQTFNLGSQGAYDTQHVRSPWVIKDGNTYKAWYGGANTNWRILYATSVDGENWSNHQMVVDTGMQGTYDTVHVFEPCVIKDNDIFKMWYTGYNGTNYRIFYAESPDGVSWSDHQLVVDLGTEGTFDTQRAYYPSVIKDNGTYRMWYSGYDATANRIIHATSADGITWSNAQVVIDIGVEGTYDSKHVTVPYVRRDAENYFIYYSGYSTPHYRVLQAQSVDGINWSKHRMVLDVASEGASDTQYAFAPFVLKDGDIYRRWHSGWDGSNWRIIYTESLSDIWKTPAQNVWDNNFVGVWHMAQDPAGGLSSIIDSSSNSHDGTPNGSMTPNDLVKGKIGSSLDFDGNDDLIDIPHNAFISLSKFSISALVKLDSIASFVSLISKDYGWSDSSSSNNANYDLRIGSNKLRLRFENSSGSDVWLTSQQTITPAEWYYVVGTFDSTTDTMNLYINGSLDISTTSSQTPNVSNTQPVRIGRYYGSKGWEGEVDGIIDEVNISNTERSASWIKATYHSNFDDLLVYSIAHDITPPAEVDTLAVNVEGDGSTVLLDWTGYDEAAVGDVSHFKIYADTSPVADVVGLMEVDAVGAGQFTYTVNNLTKGTTYYFAVVAVDFSGNALNTISFAVTATPVDTVPPEDVTNLRFERYDTRLVIHWGHSANADGDLSGYRIHLDDAALGDPVSSTQNYFEVTGLSPATAYSVRVTALDHDGNESSGVTADGITLHENPGDVVGEVGIISDLNHNERTVLLKVRYQHPLVFAQPLSYNGGDQAVARITDVQPDRFTIKIHEMPGTSDGGDHTTESISFFVFEKGDWLLPDGMLLKVGTLETPFTVGAAMVPEWHDLAFSGPRFIDTPVVISQVQSNNDSHWVKTRMKGISRDGFRVSLEEEESKNTSHHVAETVGWMALEPIDTILDGRVFKAGMTSDVVSHQWHTISGFEGFSQAPYFLAALASYNGGDNAHLRYQNLTATGVAVKVEEDTTSDSETDHAAEIVGWLALEGGGLIRSLTFADTVPPVLASSDPADGSSLRTVEQISFIIADPYGSLDENSVSASLVVSDSSDQPVSGSTTVAGGQYTFVPDTRPLAGDAYLVSFSASDLSGNADDIRFAFTVDTVPPRAVDDLQVDEEGDGFTVVLNWSAYDESVDGDIQSYRIYRASSDFSDAANATLLDTVNAGSFNYTVQNLERDTTYWFAVVAVDLRNNADNNVMAVPGSPIDTSPPQEATGLKALSVDNTLIFSWTHSLDSDNDLAGYRVYLADDTAGVFLASDRNNYTAGDLDPAAPYPFRVAAVDHNGNESSGVTITGVTLLDHPLLTKVSARVGGVKLYWDAPEPSEFVKQYRVYVSESDFTSIEGMTPRVTTTSLSAAITGLAAEATYYFAVTVVNVFDGERKEVAAISSTPVVGTNVSGVITRNTTWSLAGSPYIVTGDITIRHSNHTHMSSPSRAALTIEPGVVVRFEPGTGLFFGVNHSWSGYAYWGALNAVGTDTAPVTFTSNAGIPSPGDWKGIYFRDATQDSSTILQNCIVEYAGHTYDSNIYLANANPAIKSSTIRRGGGHGIYLRASSPTIADNHILENHGDGIYSDDNSYAAVTDNTFIRNGASAVNIHPNSVRKLSGNSGSDNARNYINVRAGNITSSGAWSKQALDYVVVGDITVRHPNHTHVSSPAVATLTINPGVSIKFAAGTGLYVGYPHSWNSYGYRGALNAVGADDSAVVFTSDTDSPAPGDWKGIYFRDETHDSSTILQNCIVEYGGHTHKSNIYLANAKPVIKSSTIRRSSGQGIYLKASSPTIAGNNILDNQSDGIYSDGSSYAAIFENNFSSNGASALNVHPNSVRKLSGNSGSDNARNYIRIRTGNITSNGVWSGQPLEYLVDGDITVRHSNHTHVSSPAVTTLTIDPGVTIKFSTGTGLYIGYAHGWNDYGYRGALDARGTQDQPITFTSGVNSPAPGDWKGIYFRDETHDGATKLQDCVAEYGGHTHNSNIYVANAKPVIKNLTIRLSSGHGIYLKASSPTITDNNILDNQTDGIYSDGSSYADISDNTFTGNGASAINLHPNSVRRLSGNFGSDNGRNYIHVRAGFITTSGIWSKQPLDYVAAGDITVRHSNYTHVTNPSVATLTLDPGVSIKFSTGTGLYVGYHHGWNDYGYRGALDARGTQDQPINFTALGNSPAPGDWKGIYFQDETHDPTTILEHCIVEYAGASDKRNITYSKSSSTLKNSIIRHSSGNGIYLVSASPLIEANLITENANAGIYSDDSSSALIQYNTFSDNGADRAANLYPNSVRKFTNNAGSGSEAVHIWVRGGSVTTNSTWSNQGMDFVIGGDITVRHANYTHNSIAKHATLTLDPGAVLRFESGKGLYVGAYHGWNSYGYWGALKAQSTASDPIILTSNDDVPRPGAWKGIYFRNEAIDAASLVEHCIIEFGGHTHNANIYLANAKPALQYNTIRNSSHSGIYVNGTGSNGVSIRCNNLKDNYYGVNVVSNAAPFIHDNNFLRNKTHGIKNTGSVTVNASDNWFNDVSGPGFNGDDVYGKVTASPFLTAESDCISTPPTNTVPFTPKNPAPANKAVRVPVVAEGQPIAVSLSWSGGDPNPWDTVVYDVYFGTAADSLTVAAEGVDSDSYDKTDLAAGTTYFWKIVARDDAGGQTAGPVWQFTTLGDPPDLVLSDLGWQPAAELQAGQIITFTATVENAGSGPVVDGFQVALYVNGSRIGGKTVNPVIAANTSMPLTFTWTAVTGDHGVEARADSTGNVAELYEENNSRTVDLPHVIDPTPPELVSTVPVNGASLKQAGAIEFTLKDQYGVVDDAAVIAGVTVLDGDSQPVAGILTEASDRFTFTPATVPLPDDTYRVSLTARDLEGNSQDYHFSFTVDGQPPTAPAITGGVVLSGLIQSRPVVNQSKTATIILTGSREDNTAVYVNSQKKINTGSGNWSAQLSLAQGDNALEIHLQDAAGNHSPAARVDILVDSVAPAITGITPADNSFINAAPSAVSVMFSEATSGLNIADSSLSVKDLNQQPVAGSWSLAGPNQLIFTATAGWADSNYTVNLELADQVGNRSIAKTYRFTLDTSVPAAPVVTPVNSPTYKPTQEISGTKEAYAALLLNGTQILGHTARTDWTHSAALNAGDNNFTFVARDRAGNQSDPATAAIFFDDVPPPAVTSLTLDTAGDGRTIKLDWTGYDEAAHGDVAGYRIYRSTAGFTDVAAASLIAELPAGNYRFIAAELARNTTYWFAVVAVDARGNVRSEVLPVSGTAKDIVPPENVSNLIAQSFADRLVFNWTHSPDSHGDLAGYRVVFEADGTNEIIAADRNTLEKTGLASAGGYLFKVYAVDNDANESSGQTVTGVTLLANPVNLTAEVHSGYVDLSWDGVSPAQYVEHYAIYASESDFSSAAGMTPTLTSAATAAKVAGLTNGVTYYFAVATVNLSDGQDPAVAAISATPEADSRGPDIIDVKVDDQPLADGATVIKPVTFSCRAQDPAGVSRVEFFIDGSPVRTDYSAPYTGFWNVVQVEDGPHTLTIEAYDTLGNLTTENYSLTVSLALPPAPQITEPAAGSITNQATVTVSGRAEKFTEVTLYNNGTDTGVILAVDALGNFSVPLTLAEGENRLQAAAGNRAGLGPKSAEVQITLDTTLPVSPSNLAAQARSEGAVRLTWQAPVDTEVAGYNLYRAAVTFTAPQGAGKLNTKLITATAFDDLPPSDGTWYYRVSAVDTASNESDLSTEAAVRADGTAPRAVAIDYSPQGAFDAATGTMAPGTVNVVLTVSEPLQSDPYSSIAPDGGIPLAVQLSRDTDTSYSGFFVISDSTPGGTAYAIFSARDAVGNRGTAIDSGRTIKIDTDGPSVTRLVLTPPAPLANDEHSPVSVTLVLGLDEPIKPNEFPQLSYRLSGDERDAITIDSLTEVAAQAPDAQTWQAQFTLPADAGLAAAETFYFIYRGRDALDNAGERIQAPNIFQVYQGDLPPLAAPLEFKGQALPEGRIRLTWLAVGQAVGYQLYRKAPGETELTPYARLDTVQAFEDAPVQDGAYTYAVASIRRENDQEALSGLSGQVVVNSDATAPGTPLNLALELVANGIKITWQSPPYTEDITYALYRSDVEITSLNGLAPLATDIGQTLVVDPTPSLSDHWYAVTAVDKAGNESAPSNADYLNIQLLPVSGITVVQVDDQPPAVSWTHPGGDIAGFDIYLGPDGAPIKLNPDLLTGKSYTDAGYGDDERRYTIVTVDNSEVESLGRSLTLPALRAVLSGGSRIERGIMNRLDYAVSNEGAGRVDNIRLKVRVGSHDHNSEPFSLDPGTSRTIPVVVGGYDDLQEELAALTTTIDVVPRANEVVRIIRSGRIEVADGRLRLQILNEEFFRAGSGQVQFILENTGEERIEIVTAKNSGNSASDQITFYLVDEDDNVLSSRSFKQATGAKTVTLSNKNTVVRIAAGETFTSDPISLPVPANAPDEVTIRLEIDHVYYHQGQATQVKMNGPATTHTVALVDTAYYGELLDITPQSATGDQDIMITGQAVERAGGQAMAQVPLSLVITLDGFERTYDVFAGEDGQFTYRFKPLERESGIYRVRAVHPDRTDKPVHGQFVINKVAVTPAILNLNAPKNYTNTIRIQVQTGDGTAVDNLRLEYASADQPTGEKPAGVHLTPGQPVAALGGKKTAYLPFTIWADNTAGSTEKLKLTVKSGDADPIVWGSVTINARFSEAKPSLYFSPNHVETGVARGKTVSEVVRLENKGLADLYDVRLSLLDAAKNPAPSWIYLNSAAAVGNLALGATKPVGIAFSPTAAVAEGEYAFYLRVAADNHPTTDIHLYVAVTQEGQGSALFKVSDIYTGTLGENGEIIQGLAGARVKLQNEAVLTEEYVKLTDDIGEAWFENIPAGRYKCRITAKNHQEYIGRVWIKPGVTTTEDVFLDYNLVTVEWSVTEITIEDKYDIVLTAVYETNVPAAVVVIEPASVTLPAMKAGDVFNGEFTLTNYGLIRADDLALSLPPDDQYFKYEALAVLPDSLAAKQRLTVPYRVTCLKSLEPDADGQATGGGCGGYRTCAPVSYGYYCANGVWTRAAVQHCWSRGWGTCSGAPINRSLMWIGIGDGGRGSVSMPAARSTSIEGPDCFREPPRTEQDCGDEDRCPPKDTSDNRSQPTGSSVNMVMREYTRDQVDLAVKVPGGTIRAKRRYYANQWRWEHERNKLKLQPSAIGGGTESIDKGGVVYEKSSLDADIFINDIFRIVKTDTGYRWQEPKGGWIEYDADGNMIARGNRTGVQAKLLYQDGKLTGAADRNDNQVLWYETDDDGLITAVSDSENRRVAYTYANGRLSSVTDVLGFVTGFDYDSQGRLETIVEPAGRIITVSYDKYNGVASVVDNRGEGYFFDFEYNEATGEQYARIESSSGKIKEVWYDRDFEIRRVDINGRTVKQIAKDGRNLLVTDEQGNVTRKNYDEWDNLTKVIYPGGSSVSYKYEHKYNRRVEAIDENEVITRYAYDDRGNMIRKVEAADTDYERVTEYTYDGDGNLLTTRRLADANTAEVLTQLGYDDLGNLTSITDPEGGVTRFTSHDAMGNALSKIDARGKLWKYEYDAAGNLRKVIDPLGYGPEFFYDEMGKKIKEVDANNTEKLYDYDEKNHLISVTDTLGNSTRYEHDPEGRLLRQIDAEGNTINYEYDLDGRLLKTVDGNGNEIAMEYADANGSGCSSCAGAGGASNQPSRIVYPTFAKEFVYDKRGRKTLEKDVLSAAEVYLTHFEYDPVGNLIARTDKEDKTTGYAYDELNRLKTVTDPLNQDTAYFYDNRDNLTALTDAEGNTTWFEYDRNNRLIKEVRPEGQQTAYDYDDAGNLIEKIDAKNQKTEYEYDDAGRLAYIRYFAAAGDVNPSKTVSFSYDNAGNLTGYDDGMTSAVYAYDDLYRKLSETINYGGFEQANNYTYYKNGLKKTFTGPDGVTYAYTYDDNNQLTGVNIPGAGYITYSAYQWNRPTEVILPGGGKREFTYDPLMRMKSISAKDPAQNILLNYHYDYDKVDNITAKVTEHGDYGYGYDDLYRLTSADNPVQADEGFSYDAVGNRLTAQGVTGDWSYDDNNELQGYDGVTFEYDAIGNMTQKTDAGQVTNYIYNVEDRLEEIRDGSGSLISSYYYDPFGRRLWKEVNGVKTYFVYADEGLIAEVDADGNVVKSYGYRPGSNWTTDPLFMKTGGQYYFYHNDHLGTPQKLTAVNGAVVWSAKYSSFGVARINSSSTVINNLRFSGQYLDQETNLHFNWHRFFDPHTGRYLRPDPIRQLGWLNNNYTYVHGNPVGYIDPAGLFSCLPNGRVDPRGKPSSPSEGAAAWAQYQFEQKNKNYTFAADNPSAGGKNQWKCNSFVRDALVKGGGVDPSQLPKHYHKGKKGPYFATANEIADPNKNTDVLGEGDGSTGDLVAWGSDSGMGHTGIVGCNGKIYSATKDEISKWNNGTWTSFNQLIRYERTGRKKVYRRLK